MSSPFSLRDTLAGGIGVTTGFVLGLFTRTVFRRFRPQLTSQYSSDSEEDIGWEPAGSVGEAHKLVLCVRTDLKMSKGKIAAQVGHATIGAYKRAETRNPTALRIWEHNAQPKIALQVSSRHQAEALDREARRRGLVTYMVHDAGRTQIAAGSLTVLAVGPGPDSLVNQVTGSLRLL
ncbi:Peptidyl-tRNA hydrolase 2, mitochondrial [Chondrus crispus]|uniref:peptidyl-tRNA hydrolase n=1 Tax=Chondrus crispus TaxID=2769 RepID=R7QT15_CHOCR|nr:Peptidyl-tRNA hydrolase 2, mitochondrial [Chondrus crispus]CDF41279.1 Peptidyl-tRNA hydrolase 2, mitochondrial [Chondrus crispus]|eukprot:XP_005711573.1 Peptidyl-tRNA hydrolase 2, mitochondrial [Chondrus crispus]